MHTHKRKLSEWEIRASSRPEFEERDEQSGWSYSGAGRASLQPGGLEHKDLKTGCQAKTKVGAQTPPKEYSQSGLHIQRKSGNSAKTEEAVYTVPMMLMGGKNQLGHYDCLNTTKN